jgi:hypothetical protein
LESGTLPTGLQHRAGMPRTLRLLPGAHSRPGLLRRHLIHSTCRILFHGLSRASLASACCLVSAFVPDFESSSRPLRLRQRRAENREDRCGVHRSLPEVWGETLRQPFGGSGSRVSTRKEKGDFQGGIPLLGAESERTTCARLRSSCEGVGEVIAPGSRRLDRGSSLCYVFLVYSRMKVQKSKNSSAWICSDELHPGTSARARADARTQRLQRGVWD